MRFLFALLLAGCTFSPSLDGVFRCDSDGDCPSGLTCDGDRVCRATGAGDAAMSPPHGPGPEDLRAVDDMKKPVDDMAMKPHPDMSMMPPPPPPSDMAMTCMPAVCGPETCGEILNGCGAKLKCMDCHGKDMVCGGGGPNECGKGMCTPITCASVGASCGLVSDGCSKVLDCGHCGASALCVQNQCI